MARLFPLVAATAIGLGGLTACSSFHHNDQTARSKSSQDTSQVAGYGGDTSFSEGGTAAIEDHRNDAGKLNQAQPASEKQTPTPSPTNNDDFSD